MTISDPFIQILTGNRFYITESFNINNKHFTPAFDFIHNNLCESTALEHKFYRWFCTQKQFLNVRFNDSINKY